MYFFYNGYSGAELISFSLKTGYTFLFFVVPLLWISISDVKLKKRINKIVTR